jgi:hypothetical protein
MSDASVSEDAPWKVTMDGAYSGDVEQQSTSALSASDNDADLAIAIAESVRMYQKQLTSRSGSKDASKHKVLSSGFQIKTEDKIAKKLVNSPQARAAAAADARCKQASMRGMRRRQLASDAISKKAMGKAPCELSDSGSGKNDLQNAKGNSKCMRLDDGDELQQGLYELELQQALDESLKHHFMAQGKGRSCESMDESEKCSPQKGIPGSPSNPALVSSDNSLRPSPEPQEEIISSANPIGEQGRASSVASDTTQEKEEKVTDFSMFLQGKEGLRALQEGARQQMLGNVVPTSQMTGKIVLPKDALCTQQ